MNLTQLRAFHAVASEGSFTTAARALEVTQPTISSQVKALESTYGGRLFDRRGREVVVTGLGRALLGITNQMFGLEQEAQDILAAAQELEHGQIKVGADGPHHVIPILAAFNRRYPGIDVTLNMGNSEQVLSDLQEYKIDVAVMAKADDSPHLFTTILKRCQLVLFVPRTHPWARRHSVELKEVAEQRMILREAASVTRQIFQSALDERDIAPQSVMQIESREAVREAVAANLGIGVVSEAEFDYDQRLKMLRVSDARLEITEHVVCLKDRYRLRVVRAFLDIAAVAAPDTIK